jgi:hypothetical protein
MFDFTAAVCGAPLTTAQTPDATQSADHERATDDPVLTELEQSLTALVEELSTESTLYGPSTSNNAR